jgi:hypothetical protein
MDLSVLIINWNTKEDLRNCLRSLCTQKFRHSVEIVVADNASSDGSREMVVAEFPEVHLVVHSTNLGFGAGNNRAFSATHARYVLFLNSDTLVTECALDRLVNFADAHPDVGIIGPKLLNRDGSLQYSCRSFPNLATGLFRNTPLGRLFPKNRFNREYLLTDWDHTTPREVDWVSGAAMLVRREAFQQLGGFDEGYFMYCEDVDLCYRAHQVGWKVVYFPDSVIYHLIGRSSDKVPARMTYHFHKSMYRFYKKHYARSTPFFVRPLIIPGLIARSAGQILRYRWLYFKRRLRGGRG